jgi:hypothetical protein
MVMKRFKVQFIKVQSIQSVKRSPTQLAEQQYLTDSDKIDIGVPPGYAVVAITEYLPIVNQCKNEKVISDN